MVYVFKTFFMKQPLEKMLFFWILFSTSKSSLFKLSNIPDFFFRLCAAYLVGEILGMRGSESDPHVGIDAWHSVQQVGEAQTSLFWSVDGLEAPAELGQVWAAELLLWRVSVAVHVLTQQSHLLHTLNKNIQHTRRVMWLTSSSSTV